MTSFMSGNSFGSRTRRELLQTIPAAILGSLFSSKLGAAPGSTKPLPPFSRFVDVAQAAALTEPTICGEPNSFTYIIESMATGCAFFDYDNDGWMDIFMACVLYFKHVLCLQRSVATALLFRRYIQLPRQRCKSRVEVDSDTLSPA